MVYWIGLPLTTPNFPKNPKAKPYRLADSRGLHLLVTPVGGKCGVGTAGSTANRSKWPSPSIRTCLSPRHEFVTPKREAKRSSGKLGPRIIQDLGSFSCISDFEATDSKA